MLCAIGPATILPLAPSITTSYAARSAFHFTSWNAPMLANCVVAVTPFGGARSGSLAAGGGGGGVGGGGIDATSIPPPPPPQAARVDAAQARRIAQSR